MNKVRIACYTAFALFLAVICHAVARLRIMDLKQTWSPDVTFTNLGEVSIHEWSEAYFGGLMAAAAITMVVIVVTQLMQLASED